MRRVGSLAIALVASLGCTAREDPDNPASGDTTGGHDPSSGTDDAIASSTGASNSRGEATTADVSDDETGSSSTGSTGAECPSPSDDLGAVVGLVWPRAWAFEGEAGISEGTCSATSYDGELLELQCAQDDARAGPQPFAIRGGGPVVGDALAAIVGMTDLRVSFPYAMGFFPGYFVSRWSLRTASGELLVLSSNDGVGPGGALGVVDGSPDWAAPFSNALTAVDQGCAIVLARPDTFPPAWQPFALSVEADAGTALVFDGNQATVEMDGVAYEVSARMARTPTRQCMKCPESETSFSIVRHPP